MGDIEGESENRAFFTSENKDDSASATTSTTVAGSFGDSVEVTELTSPSIHAGIEAKSPHGSLSAMPPHELDLDEALDGDDVIEVFTCMHMSISIY